MNWIRVDKVLDVLFPPECLLCGQGIGKGIGKGTGTAPVCAGCDADLPWLRERCPHCALPMPGGHGDPCGCCPPALGGFASVGAALRYEYPVDRLIAAAKFGGRLPVARALGGLLDLAMPRDEPPPDLVVPVPLHWRRHAQRGFNQAEEIARGLCRLRNWRLEPDLCRRWRNTSEQSALPAADRRQNLRKAFRTRKSVSGARILVVDDVLTTGATAEALAMALRAAGAAELSLWAVARTLA